MGRFQPRRDLVMGQSETSDPAQETFRQAFWKGYYEACRALDQSPRMNRPQREVIQGLAYEAQKRLEELGVVFDA
jgi:hypothetical protein